MTFLKRRSVQIGSACAVIALVIAGVAISAGSGTRPASADLPAATSSGDCPYTDDGTTRVIHCPDGPTPTVTETQTVAGPTTTQTVTVTGTPTTTAPTSPTTSPTTPVSGFPDATTTGYPAGTTLTAYAGPTDLTTANTPAGTVYSGVLITKALTIEAGVTVTFKNCSDTVKGANMVTGKPGANVTFSYCTFNGGYSLGTQAAFIGSGITVDHVNVYGVGEGAQMDGSFTVTDSYIHDLYGASGSHNNAVFSNGSQTGPISITGNTLSAVYTTNDTTSTTGVSGAASFYGDFAQVNNVTITGNLIYSQNTGIYGGSIASKKFPTSANVTIQDNEFSSKFGDSGLVDFKPGVNGDSADVGNVWIDGPNAGKSAG